MRTVYFFTRQWQFFLLDFCYFVNTVVLVFLLFLPNHARLGAMCWCVSLRTKLVGHCSLRRNDTLSLLTLQALSHLSLSLSGL